MDVLNPDSAQWIEVGVHGTNVHALVSMLDEGMSTAYSQGKTARRHHHLCPTSTLLLSTVTNSRV
eukprot:6197226-Alexandrium_andersonii.AAC.1